MTFCGLIIYSLKSEIFESISIDSLLKYLRTFINYFILHLYILLNILFFIKHQFYDSYNFFCLLVFLHLFKIKSK